MGEFGKILRKEREARGVALETITKATKISNRHLVALEGEQFEVLPGGVFNKGIVRGYARVVGLNEEEWVARYLAAYRSSGAAPEDETGWAQFAENASKARADSQGRRPEMRLRWTGIAVLLLIVGGLSWFAWSYIHKKNSAVPHAAGIRQRLRSANAPDASDGKAGPVLDPASPPLITS
jgi:cytoskeletal protein RodZ